MERDKSNISQLQLGARKGPAQSATTFKFGTKKRGLDGGIWEIARTKDGVKRWNKVSKPRKPRKPRTPRTPRKVSTEDLKRLTNKYKVSVSGSKKTIAEGLWRVRGQAMSDKDLLLILDLLPRNVQNIIKKQVKENVTNPIIDYKGMWRPLKKSISTFTREELIRDLRHFREAWEKITTRNQDLSNERLADETTTGLRNLLKFYYSNGSKKLAEKWLRDNH